MQCLVYFNSHGTKEYAITRVTLMIGLIKLKKSYYIEFKNTVSRCIILRYVKISIKCQSCLHTFTNLTNAP